MAAEAETVTAPSVERMRCRVLHRLSLLSANCLNRFDLHGYRQAREGFERVLHMPATADQQSTCQTGANGIKTLRENSAGT